MGSVFMKIIVKAFCTLFFVFALSENAICQCGTPAECYEKSLKNLETARAEINQARAEINQLSDKIRRLENLENNRTRIVVGGTCFSPRQLIRCMYDNGEHLTWVDNAGECRSIRGSTIEGEATFLAGCR